MFGLNQAGFIGLSLATLAAAGFVYSSGHNAGYASAAKQSVRGNTQSWVREYRLWALVRSTNESKHALIVEAEGWMQATGKARRAAQAAISREKENTRKALNEADGKITELLNAAKNSEWAGKPVDPIFVEQLRDATNGNDSDPIDGTDSGDDMEVREPSPKKER